MKARHQFRLAAVIGLGLLASGAAWAELYKWVDEQGNVTYSQVPPPGRKVTTVAPPPPPPDGASPGRKDYMSSSTSGSEDLEDAKQKKDLAAVAKKNCQVSKRNLEIYRTQGRIRTETGEVLDLDEKTRAEKVAAAEKDVKAFCH